MTAFDFSKHGTAATSRVPARALKSELGELSERRS